MISAERLENLLGRMGRSRIGLLGDCCLDAYWTLDDAEAELSVETGRPTQAVASQRYSLGGGANVVANLAALEPGALQVFAVIGDDLFGREMLRQFDALKVNHDGVVVQSESWDTPVYAKPHLNGVEQDRIDFGRLNRIALDTERRLLDCVTQALPGLDVLIVNQQLPLGVTSPGVIDELNAMAAKCPGCIFLVDSRDRPASFRNMILKLNAREAAALRGVHREIDYAMPVDELEGYLRSINERTGKAVVGSRGARGLVVFDGQGASVIPGIHILQQTDPVGAGDTVASALAACLAAGADIVEAATVANVAAAVTVRKLYTTGTASRREIMEIGADPDYVYEPELAEDIRRARNLPGKRIEIVRDDIATGQIRHALFDHDGTISTLRQDWERVMEPVMIRAILGKAYEQADETEFRRVSACVRKYIDQSTGIQTIQQMQGLVDLVRQFGYVPAAELRTAQEYKDVYNDALMDLVSGRIQQILDGELSVADYTIKGAVDFLHELHSGGIQLYLASGTDEDDVKREAELLGYAELFEGRIYGAVGDVSKYSKKMVIDRIIRENGLNGPQLVCFGDGPVELRETRKRHGITVGIASNEARRFGLNPEKRTRLIRAGADIVVPDFTQRGALLRYLSGQ